MSDPSGDETPKGGSKRRRRRRRGRSGKRPAAKTVPSQPASANTASAKPAPAKAASAKPAPAKAASAKPAPAVHATAPSIPETPGDATSNGAAPHVSSTSRRARAERETSAGGIVYRVHDGEALFLLIRDSYRNWGFPKGHLESGELPEDAAVREVREETGLADLQLAGAIETIDWFFRFRGRLVHKVCHFYLMRTRHTRTVPQREEGITACRWARFDEARRLVSYANARAVLTRAHDMVRENGHAAAGGGG